MKQVLCESALQRRKGFVAFTFEEELGRKSTYIVLCSIIFKRNRKYSSCSVDILIWHPVLIMGDTSSESV